MKLGIKTQPQFVSYDELVLVWQEADDAGFDSAWLHDHLMPLNAAPEGPCLEGWTLLANLAAKTERIRIGMIVASTTYHHPVLLAKMAATVDICSRGRLEAGFGSGSGFSADEHARYGIPWPRFAERVARLEEACEIMKRLWTEEVIEYQGKYYRIAGAPFAPKPIQKPHPPIMIGGKSDRTLEVVARQASGWNVAALPEPVLRERLAKLEEECRRAGRDPDEIEKSIQVFVDYDRLPELAGQLRRHADLGFNHLILTLRPPYRAGMVRRLAEELLPA